MFEPSDPLPKPDDIQKFFESWWRVGSAIVGTLVSVLAVLNISPPTSYFIAVPLTVAGIGLAIYLYRWQVREKTKQDATKAGLNARGPTAAPGAFRGLRRFLRGETLPGPQRRRDAAQLLRQVTHRISRLLL
jgi:hypothetical protein